MSEANVFRSGRAQNVIKILFLSKFGGYFCAIILYSFVPGLAFHPRKAIALLCCPLLHCIIDNLSSLATSYQRQYRSELSVHSTLANFLVCVKEGLCFRFSCRIKNLANSLCLLHKEISTFSLWFTTIQCTGVLYQ